MSVIYLHEIEPLENMLDTLIFEEEPSIFTEEHANELVETALHLMDEYMIDNPNVISEPNFHEILLEEIKEIFYIQMEDHILTSDFIEEDMNELIEDAFQIYITIFHTERTTYINEDETENINNMPAITDNELEIISKKIQGLRELPQPVQRTAEWYQFRWNLITASNAWKAFESQKIVNQLIYEKCQPLQTIGDEMGEYEDIKMVNTNTTLHWGQKYEPLSVMLYELLYDSKVEDFGCIQHPLYKFIGASPDGIVVKSNTGRYGYMLEIKNIVNREINGIPKKEYWVQMQLQMEVCDLDKCDFLETKFNEYPDYESYKNDSIISTFEGNEFKSFTTTADGNYKGIIIYFHTKEGKPHYEYMPLTIWTPDDVANWEESMVHKYESAPYNYVFIKFIYWKLEKISCVLVLRNRVWFENNIGQLEKVWKIIEEERVSGYEHRAPSKKAKKELPAKPYIHNKEECFLQVIKIDTEPLTFSTEEDNH